jgi:DNA-binding Lrp family transcriptional regulator
LNQLSFLDENNRKIIGLLQEDPGLTQSDLAAKLHISQSAVAMRLAKLAKAGVFMRGSGLSYNQLGLRMGRVDIEAVDFTSILHWANCCPLFVNASLGIGGRSLSLLFVAEDLQMFHYLIDEHVRKLKGVRALDFSEIVSWTRDFPVNINLDYPKREAPPCGMLPFCPGCPGNPKYNGRVWSYLKQNVAD